MPSNIANRRRAAKAGASEIYEQRRKEIAEAATRVFHRLGYQGTSMGAVADEMGIDRASLYYYISSKAELFDEVVHEVVENNLAIANRILEGEGTPPDKLRELISAIMRSFQVDYPLLYIYLGEDLRRVGDKRSKWSRKMAVLNRDYEDALVRIIEDGYRDGSFRNVGPARLVTNGIFGMLNWSKCWYKPERSEHSAEEIARTFAEMVLGGMASSNWATKNSSRSK